MAATSTSANPVSASEDAKSGKDLIADAAASKPMTHPEHSAALEWFLSEDPADDGKQTRTIDINVGGDAEHFIPWTIRAIDLDTLRRIRKAVSGTRAQRRSGGELDEVAANLRIVVEGTEDPNLVDAAKQLGIASPESALKIRFARKPGLIGQIAGEILSLSGYDEEDVREVQAAKNS